MKFLRFEQEFFSRFNKIVFSQNSKILMELILMLKAKIGTKMAISIRPILVSASQKMVAVPFDQRAGPSAVAVTHHPVWAAV